jgi:hypothetical protein
VVIFLKWSLPYRVFLCLVQLYEIHILGLKSCKLKLNDDLIIYEISNDVTEFLYSCIITKTFEEGASF